MKNTEFKVTKSKNQTVFTLESATGGGTSAGSVASVSNPVGGVRRRVSNLVTSEAGTETVTVPVTQKPRQGPLKPQTGAGAHRDKKKEQKQGQVKHKKPYIEDHSDAANRGWGAGSYDTYANTRHGRGVAEGISGLGYDAQSLITKLRRDVEEKRLRPTPEAVLAAARELAGDMEFAPQLLVKQVLGQGVAEGPNDGKEDNFTIDDIKRLEKIRDLETLKAQAKELIKGKPARRMKPEKISWFYNHIDTLRNPLAVIKMMYDLMLAGEGNKVIGSRNSMSSNSYRTRFGEDHEIQMASSELQSIAKNAEHLLDLVRKYSEQQGLQAWQQSKITKAADYLNSVLQSINGEQSGMEEARNNYHANTTGFGRRPRDDERHDLDTQTDPRETMMWNLTIDGEPLNPEPIMGRSNLIKFGKQQAAAGVDLSNAMISPVKNVEEDAYMMELASKLAEKIPSNAPVDAWIQDFQQANPEKYHQFRQNNRPGTKKPEAKIAQMAVAASYAAKNPSKKK